MMEWNIQSRSPACQGCGRAFRDHEALHTLLFDERQSYQRVDVCEECWTSQYSQIASHRKGFVSQWHGVYSAPPPAPPEPIQKETAEGLLRKLVALNDPQHAGACFILAVMLERKRVLKMKSQAVTDRRRVLMYEHPKSGDLFTIPDPELQLHQLEAVQRDVAALLEHGIPQAGVAEPIEAPAAQTSSEPPAAVDASGVPPLDRAGSAGTADPASSQAMPTPAAEGEVLTEAAPPQHL